MNDQKIIQQIESLALQGVLFNIISKEEATKYLKSTNYIFRLQSYLELFSYDEDNQKYNVEFFLLKELSVIDMHLRKLITSAALDIEHLIKVKTINEINDNMTTINAKKIELFLIKNKHIKDKIDNRNENIWNNYQIKLFEKYHNNWEVEPLLEIIDFGGLINFIKHFKLKTLHLKSLGSIKAIRNSAVHNSTLLSDLKSNENFKPFILTFKQINLTTQEKEHIKNPFIHDLLILIYTIGLFKSEKIITHRIKDLAKFLNIRCMRHKENNIDFSDTLISIYQMVLKFFNQNCTIDSSKKRIKII